MQTKSELLTEHTKKIKALPDDISASEGSLCAVAISIPFFIELLADIRDTLVEINKGIQKLK